MQSAGIFLGRMQPFHDGHRWLIRKIFSENSEVVICIGSAQAIDPDDPKQERNPLSFEIRRERVVDYLAAQKYSKPWRILPIADIDSDEDWPAYLSATIGIDKNKRNNVYFGESIAENYQLGLEKAGFAVTIVKRKSFRLQTPDQKTYSVGCASEIRKIYRENGFANRL